MGVNTGVARGDRLRHEAGMGRPYLVLRLHGCDGGSFELLDAVDAIHLRDSEKGDGASEVWM
jgi:hypothetical protein